MSVLALLASFAAPAFAATAPSLGQAGSFAVLGGTNVNNTGPSRLFGDLGVSPGSALTGFPPGLVIGGATHATDAVAAQAQLDTTAAYGQLAGQVATSDLSGVDLGGLTLVPGVYRFTSSALLTGTLTLDAQGDPAAVFVFQTGSTLTTASGSRVRVINGGSPCNVFWQVGSSATLNTTTSFVGNLLALTAASLRTGATVAGRVLVRNGSATLDANDITACSAVCGTITLSPGALPDGTVGTASSATISASGGAAPFLFSVTSGASPAGLTLASNGTLSGTPTTAGTFNFTVTASDSGGCTGSQGYALLINPNGSTTGDPHLRTLDGLAYEFQACGEFVLLRTSSASLEIQVRQTPWNASTSVNTAVAMRVPGHTVLLTPFAAHCDLTAASSGSCALVDGRSVTFECGLADQAPGCLRSLALPGVGRLEQRVRGLTEDRHTKALVTACDPARAGSCAAAPAAAPCGISYTLELLSGERVETCVSGGYLNLTVGLPSTERGRTSGLLGNGDGDPRNDLDVGAGAPLSLQPSFEEFYGRFGDHWRVAAGQSLFASLPVSGVCAVAPFRLDDLAPAARAHGLATCSALGIDPGTLDECALDVAVLGDAAAASFIGMGPPRAVVTLRDPGAVGCEGCGSTGGGPLTFALALLGLTMLASRRRAAVLVSR